MPRLFLAAKKPIIQYLRGDRFPGLGSHTNNKNTWMVLVCSHREKLCRDYAPVWEELAKQIRPVVKVGTLDCSVPANNQICRRHVRQNAPTILRVGTDDKGKFTVFKTLKRKNQKKRSTRHRVEQLARFAYSVLPAQAQLHNIRTDKNLESFLEQCKANCGKSKQKCECALIFSSKYETTPAAKAVAAHLSSDFSSSSRVKHRCGGVGEVRASGPTHRLARRYGVTSNPAVLLVDAQTGEVTRRHTPKGTRSILKFLRR